MAILNEEKGNIVVTYKMVKIHPKKGSISGTILWRKIFLKISMTNWFHLRLEIFLKCTILYSQELVWIFSIMIDEWTRK